MTAGMKSHKPDDAEPSPERQAELRAAHDVNIAAGNPPYARVAIRTRGELRWIMQERGWGGEEAQLRSGGVVTANLQAADLQGVNLGDMDLIWANFTQALLEGADLTKAHLRGVNFTLAHLDDAILVGASLRRAIFSGTDLHRTDFSGADLHGARLDAMSILRDAVFDSQTHLADVVWNNAPLAEVDWSRVKMLGDEHAIALAKSNQERIRACWSAIRAYRGLAMALRSQGLSTEALRYRLRAIRLQRRAFLLEGNWLAAGGLWLVDATTGFGTKSRRILLIYMAVIVGYAALYFGMGNFDMGNASSAALSPVDALVFSVTSFHGRGFFPGEFPFHSPLITLAASEAVVGLLVEALIVATLARLFLSGLE